MTSVARRVSYQVLLNVAEKGTYPNIALSDALRKQTMYGDDRGLCTHIVYGTLQRQLSVDAMLRPMVKRPMKDLDLRVLTILRMTAYQLCYLSKVPVYAAVNEAVELCKSVAPRASGFVNGVLRSFMRDGRTAEERLRALGGQSNVDEEISLLYSFPSWIVRRWRMAYGEERTRTILSACNEPASLSVRVNPLKRTAHQVVAEMEREFGPGTASPSAVSPWGVRVSSGFDVEQWTLYRSGDVSVQDETAMLVSPLLGVTEGQRVLDLCAAPGSKTTHIAEQQHDKGEVVAVDIHPHKIRLIEKAVSRLGLSSVKTVLADAVTLGPDTIGMFDAVLLDAPCSGLGVLRHRPDIRWKRTEKDVAALTALQTKLLTSAMRLVKPGGVLVYSTCTLLRDENEGQIESALNAVQGEWYADDIAAFLPPAVLGVADKSAYGITITPEMFGTDGFFMARLVRRHEPPMD